MSKDNSGPAYETILDEPVVQRRLAAMQELIEEKDLEIIKLLMRENAELRKALRDSQEDYQRLEKRLRSEITNLLRIRGDDEY